MRSFYSIIKAIWRKFICWKIAIFEVMKFQEIKEKKKDFEKKNEIWDFIVCIVLWKHGIC